MASVCVSPHACSYLLIWKQLTILFSAYSVYITPFEFAFFNVPPLGLRIADNVINIFFLCDLVLTFFVAYKNTRTYLIVADHKAIAIKYLSTWFLSDLLGAVPWDLCYVVRTRYSRAAPLEHS